MKEKFEYKIQSSGVAIRNVPLGATNNDIRNALEVSSLYSAACMARSGWIYVDFMSQFLSATLSTDFEFKHPKIWYYRKLCKWDTFHPLSLIWRAENCPYSLKSHDGSFYSKLSEGRINAKTVATHMGLTVPIADCFETKKSASQKYRTRLNSGILEAALETGLIDITPDSDANRISCTPQLEGLLLGCAAQIGQMLLCSNGKAKPTQFNESSIKNMVDPQYAHQIFKTILKANFIFNRNLIAHLYPNNVKTLDRNVENYH